MRFPPADGTGDTCANSSNKAPRRFSAYRYRNQKSERMIVMQNTIRAIDPWYPIVYPYITFPVPLPALSPSLSPCPCPSPSLPSHLSSFVPCSSTQSTPSVPSPRRLRSRANPNPNPHPVTHTQSPSHPLPPRFVSSPRNVPLLARVPLPPRWERRSEGWV